MGEQRERASGSMRSFRDTRLDRHVRVFGGGPTVQRFLLPVPVQICNPTLQAGIITDLFITVSPRWLRRAKARQCLGLRTTGTCWPHGLARDARKSIRTSSPS